IVLVNFKTYEKGTGKNAVELAKACEKAASSGKALVAVAVQASDIFQVSGAVSIPVFAQHIDSKPYGKNTGFTLLEAVKEAGAAGTLLNHSEHKLDLKEIAEAIKRCRGKLTTIACAADAEEAAKIAELKPDFIAIELPELISGKVSIAKADPSSITAAIEAAKGVPVLAGAGVQDGTDMKTALELGTEGVLISNAVVNSEEPEKVVRSLVGGAE
ncbi:triose-phosphate isomerase, partial [Candidatus Woesearchaeota archaeon]|nr:triose-phosphate isomerase [Candidatus Woesearchaeota archaeon]